LTANQDNATRVQHAAAYRAVVILSWEARSAELRLSSRSCITALCGGHQFTPARTLFPSKCTKLFFLNVSIQTHFERKHVGQVSSVERLAAFSKVNSNIFQHKSSSFLLLRSHFHFFAHWYLCFPCEKSTALNQNLTFGKARESGFYFLAGVEQYTILQYNYSREWKRRGWCTKTDRVTALNSSKISPKRQFSVDSVGRALSVLFVEISYHFEESELKKRKIDDCVVGSYVAAGRTITIRAGHTGNKTTKVGWCQANQL